MGSTEPSAPPPSPSAAPSIAPGSPRALGEKLLALPAARLLLEGLTRSGHLHLGYFDTPADSLPQAQERLIQRALRYLPRSSRLVDVGCGLGGTVGFLVAQGHQVIGVDPCERSIAYARVRVGTPRAQFMAGTLESFVVRARGARFDALLLTEVLPELGRLAQVIPLLRQLVRPGGIVIVHDIVRSSSPTAGAPFHPRGALRSEADAAGFDLLEARDTTHRTSPTLPRLLRLMEEREAKLQAAFPSRASELQVEGENLRARLRRLETGFLQQELFHETTVLRSSARFTHDSVVLRRGTRKTPVAHRPQP